MNSVDPTCRSVRIVAFRGDRSSQFASWFIQSVDDGVNARGPGPTRLECLFYAGHTGVSVDGGVSTYGFNPDGGMIGFPELITRLQRREAFPGIVLDDTAIFTAAQLRGLQRIEFEIVVPDPVFQSFSTTLDSERQKSQYSYGFPNGDGECNCTTWLERLGLPLLTGRMDEFISLSGIRSYPRRRFGRCI